MDRRSSRTSMVILGLLSTEPMSGYDLRDAINRSIGHFWSESYGQIYPALVALTRKKLIAAKADRKSARGRKVYSITRAGQAALLAWLAEPPTLQPPRNELLLKVFFGRFADVASLSNTLEVARVTAQSRVRQLRQLAAQLREGEAAAPELFYWLATINYGERMAAATEEWATTTLHGLKGEKK